MRAKQKKDFRSHGLISGIMISSGILGLFSIINVSFIDNASAETSTATIRVKSTCSMTATVNTDHTASLINGVYSGDYTDTSNNTKPYENGIGKTTIQTFCNDPNGYAIYAIGYTGGDTGVANGTNTVLHSSTLGSDYDIHTGTATTGDTSNWAMKLAALDGDYKPTILNSYDNYSIIPSDYTKVASYGSNTDTATIGSSLTTTYAAYISPTQPAGTYVGQVKYVLLHPSSSLEPGTYYMQDVDEWGSQVAIGQEITAYDNRDNKSYTVRKMCMESSASSDATWQEKEENCTSDMLWMTQNLDLDLNSSVALNSINTDLNTVGTVAYYEDYTVDENGVFIWNPTATTITSIDTSTGEINGWLYSNTTPYSVDPDVEFDGIWYNDGLTYGSYLCNTSGSQTCNYLMVPNPAPNYFKQTPFDANGSHGKVGNYYNWTAAIASSNSSGLTNFAQNSICPRGWRLLNNSSQDSYRLNQIYNNGSTSGAQGFIKNPVYMIRSGTIGDNSLYYAGYSGMYWSSMAMESNPNNAYFLEITSTNGISHNAIFSKGRGMSIRCVSDNY